MAIDRDKGKKNNDLSGMLWALAALNTDGVSYVLSEEELSSLRQDFETSHRGTGTYSYGTLDLTGAAPVDGFPDGFRAVKAERKGIGVVYTDANGLEIAKNRDTTKSASLSWVCNNPGNIIYGSFAKRHGAVGVYDVGDGRKFAIFPSAEAGLQAQMSLLRGSSYNHLTLAGAISRYAPPHENHTQGYIASVSRATGISSDTRLGSLDDEQMKQLVSAMVKVEGWKEGKVFSLSDPNTSVPVTRVATTPKPTIGEPA